MRLPDFEGWAIFATVAEHGSFSRAAEVLHLSKPTVSKAVKRLEVSLGVALFSRNSRQMSVTSTGLQLLDHASQILIEAERAESMAREGVKRPSGRLRVAAPTTFGIRYLSPLLPKFLEKYPEIDLTIDCSDSLVDLVADGYDLAIRIGSLVDSSLRARKLCDVSLLLVATPTYLDRVGKPSHPADLENKKSFVYTNNNSPGILKMIHKSTGKEFSLCQSVRLQADNAEVFLPALMAHLGFGLFPDFMVRDELKTGQLEVILPDWDIVPQISLYLMTSGSKLRPYRVDVFMNYLATVLSSSPWSEDVAFEGRIPSK